MLVVETSFCVVIKNATKFWQYFVVIYLTSTEANVFRKVNVNYIICDKYLRTVKRDLCHKRNRLTGMGSQKNVPKKQKVINLKLSCLLLKKKFYEILEDFSIAYPIYSKCGKGSQF